MRLAYVCSDPGVPVFGRKGCSIHVQEVLRALLGLGIEVVLFARRFDGEAPSGLEALSIYRLEPLPKQEDAKREQAALAANETLRAALEHAGPFELVYERYALWSFAAMDYARDAGIPGLLEVNAPLIEEQAQHRKLADRAGAVSDQREEPACCNAAMSSSRLRPGAYRPELRRMKATNSSSRALHRRLKISVSTFTYRLGAFSRRHSFLLASLYWWQSALKRGSESLRL